jgi:tetratricopeptide (TPR) repeat protein
MINFKKIILIFALIVVGVADVLIYWNSHLYYRSKMIEDSEEKIEILEKLNKFYPSNDLVFYELGKAYFDLGKRNIKDRAKSNTYLSNSIQNFSRSIRIYPASQFSHFNFAQSLYYMSFLSPSLDFNSYDEYKKAAILAGHNSQIFYEVGRIFLSRWSELSDEDRDFTVKILRKLMGGKDREMLRSLMHVWEMNVKDYEVMEKILPEDPEIYRMYAKFLGEKSLSLKERQRILADAEFMEFERAKEEHNSGESAFIYYGVKKA